MSEGHQALEKTSFPFEESIRCFGVRTGGGKTGNRASQESAAIMCAGPGANSDAHEELRGKGKAHA